MARYRRAGLPPRRWILIDTEKQRHWSQSTTTAQGDYMEPKLTKQERTQAAIDEKSFALGNICCPYTTASLEVT